MPPTVDGPTFPIGASARYSGRLIMHWEWPRFEIKEPRRLLGARTVRCELVEGDEIGGSPLELIGGSLPENWRHHPGLAFNVTLDATPLARGSFGHRGTLEWRLRVDRWVSVERLQTP